jgi:hypothetical protein
MMKFSAVFLLSTLVACTSVPPANPENLCAVFQEKQQWYTDANKAGKHWGVPVPVIMAIMYQESHYIEDARPPRVWLLGIIPWFRPTTAYGYAQAVDDTWELYVKSAGSFWSDRDDFSDSADFIGWYNYQSYKRLRIAKWDTRNLYLAYHEGFEGYKHKSWLKKPWLVSVANNVAKISRNYHRQLIHCKIN